MFQITRKLAGSSAGSVAWATNIGNKYGLMCVLTASEGQGLVKGLQKHFRDANVTASCLLYVDRNCCGKVTSQVFRSGWPDITVRQDIWHFMRHIAAGVNTESHPLYIVFMGHLSWAIIAWDWGDLELLKEAKHAEMQARAILHPTDTAILKQLGHREMSLHCCCITREWGNHWGDRTPHCNLLW